MRYIWIFTLLLLFILEGCAEPTGMLKSSGHRTMPPAGYSTYCDLPENKTAKECGK